MPSWQETIIIGMGMLREVYGENPVVNPTKLPVAVPPVAASPGLKAEFLWIRPTALCHFSVNPAINTSGLYCAQLAADQEYVFPLHPGVDTIYLLDAASSSNSAYLRWVVGR